MISIRRLLAYAFAGTLLGCPNKSRDAETTSGSASTPTAEATVEVVPVVAKKLDASVHLAGELAAYESVEMHARASGFVQRVLVDRGSKVKAGELLVTITAPELSAQRAEAEAKLQGERGTYERLRAAAKVQGAVTDQELQIAEATMRADESRVQSLRTMEQYLTVTAPFDGIITERNVHPGALVGPQSGVPMLRLEQVAKLRLTVPVPEVIAGEITAGVAATFTVRAWQGQTFHAVVQRVAHSVDVHTRSMPVELDVDNSDARLAPGMFADVVWPVTRSAPSLFVPASSIVTTTAKTFVVRLNGGVVEQVAVQRDAASADGLVAVFGDLHDGDVVAKRGTEELHVGATVKTAPAKP
jgi:RND family efflux transporter MFP subunit